MATEAQRQRRRRSRQRRQGRVNRQTVTGSNSRGNQSRNQRGNATVSALNPGVWITEIHSFAITSLTNTPSNKVWRVSLQDSVDLRNKLNRSGEYRLLSLRASYNPITAKTDDRIGIAPYFDPINVLLSASDFLANGRPIRKGDSRFSETWSVASEITSVIDLTNPLDIIGGVCIYFHKEGVIGASPQTDAFIITVDVTYQIRGRKQSLNTLSGQ